MSSSDSSTFKNMFNNVDFLKSYVSNGGAHADLRLELLEAEPMIRMHLPYAAKLARSNEDLAVHSSAVITALDGAMGLAAMTSLTNNSSIATLELRYDELHSPEPGKSINVTANCEEILDDIAYVTGAAYTAGSNICFARTISRFILSDIPEDYVEQSLNELNGK